MWHMDLLSSAAILGGGEVSRFQGNTINVAKGARMAQILPFVSCCNIWSRSDEKSKGGV